MVCILEGSQRVKQYCSLATIRNPTNNGEKWASDGEDWALDGWRGWGCVKRVESVEEMSKVGKCVCVGGGGAGGGGGGEHKVRSRSVLQNSF